MTAQLPQRESDQTSLLGTLGWVGVVILLAIAAVVLLNWLGPLGGR